MTGSGQEISKVVLSPEGRICDLSERMLAHFGGGLKTQFLDRNLFDVLAELNYTELADKLYLAVKSARAGQVTTFEAGLQPPGRAALELVCSVRPRFADDELVFYEVGLLETSEDEEAAEYNQERERHFEALFDAISMAMLIVREESVIRANTAALDLLGIDNLQTLKGRNIQRIFPELPPQTPAETQLRRADGSLLKVELTITPWMLSGRRHSVLVCYDLGSQERMREVLRAATQSAEQASLAKSRLLTTMSHELRTPLNGILGLLHLAQKSPDPAKKADYLNRLERTTRGLLTIVNDVLYVVTVSRRSGLRRIYQNCPAAI